MKMIFAALLVAATCCFAPGTSLYVPHANSDEDNSARKFSCLATLTGARKDDAKMVLVDFLCTWPKYMIPKNKEELIEFVEEIVNITGCTQRDFLGPDTNIEELDNDLEGALQKLTLKAKQLLRHLHKTEIPISFCKLLDILRNNAAATLEETSSPSGHRRLTRSLGGALGGVTSLLDLLNNLSPLLNVVGMLGGTVGNVLSPVSHIANSLLGGGNGLMGLLGGNQGGVFSLLNGGLLDGIVGGGKGGLLGGALGGLLGGGQGCGVGGGAGDALLGGLLGGGKGQANGGLINSLTSLAGGLTGGVLGENGMLGGLLGGANGGNGLLGGVTNLAGGLTGGVLGGNKGQGSGGLLGGVTGGLLGGGQSGGLLGSLMG
ncbi:uncharacterized protein LOC143962892 isoform X2 [Lithobates pipiens]